MLMMALLMGASTAEDACIPKTTALDQALDGAVGWACFSGQSGVHCDDMPAHCTTSRAKATFAFSKYYAEFKDKGGSCDFNGNAHLAAVTQNADCVFGYVSPSPSPASCSSNTWTDVKLSCGGCKVLADNMSSTHRTCSSYCGAQGLACVGAWEESANSCTVLDTKDCSFDFDFTSDAICECGEGGSLPAPTPPSATPAPGGCSSDTWTDVKLPCGGCKVLADNMSSTHRTCSSYCGAQGLACVGAWEESANSCTVLHTKDCAFDFDFTSDAICECGAGGSLPAPTPPPSTPAPGGGQDSRCGIATSLGKCAETQAAVGVAMECFSYGGSTDKCSLNNNNDPNNGLDKNPLDCSEKHFFLWDEPDTQGYSYGWAGVTWKSYCTRWSSELAQFKARGGKVVGPAVKNDKYVDNMHAFFDSCGSACREEGPCKIDEAAANVFVGSWNNGNLRGGIQWSIDQFKRFNQQAALDLPVSITNWSYLGSNTADAQLDAMQVTEEFFKASNPVRITQAYYFLARDFGGGTTNNLATDRTSDGRTLGEHWREICERLDH